VAVAERELQVLALQRSTVTDAGDLELLLETLGDAFDQIGDLRARAVPYMACARLVSIRGATLTAPSSNFTSTSSCTTN